MGYSKTLTSKNMDTITNIAENKIIEASDKITNAEFNIEPKKIGKNNYGCTLCKFKDICFHTNDDIVELKELTDKEVLGVDTNGMD